MDSVTDLITSLAALAGALAWPTLALVVIIRFREGLGDFFQNLANLPSRRPGLRQPPAANRLKPRSLSEPPRRSHRTEDLAPGIPPLSRLSSLIPCLILGPSAISNAP